MYISLHTMVGVNSFAFRSAASPKTRKTNLQENSTVLRKTGPKTRGKFEPIMEPILVQKWTNFWSENGLIFGPKMDQFLVQKWTNFWSKKQQPLFADFFRRKKSNLYLQILKSNLYLHVLGIWFRGPVVQLEGKARVPKIPASWPASEKATFICRFFSNLYLQKKKQPLFARLQKATFICRFFSDQNLAKIGPVLRFPGALFPAC